MTEQVIMKNTPDLLVSADSHVIEPSNLWAERLPPQLRDLAPSYPPRTTLQAHDGGLDPRVRAREMAMDGVSGEILYASLALKQFGLTDATLQESCFRIYNDWLIDYCAHTPERLFGVGTISTYRIDNAVQEAHRCRKAGMRGLMIWQVPPPELSFAGDHYERFWATAQELQMPVSMHTLTGMPYGPDMAKKSTDVTIHLAHSVNMKLLYANNALLQIITSGVLERFPRLKIVLVENEASWLPFVLSEWDKYCLKGKGHVSQMTMLPSEYFKRQVYATFFNDPPARLLFSGWGIDNCMWSNDFPHQNSTWPKSRDVIARDLGHLPGASRAKILHENVTRLYDLPAFAPVTD